MRTLAAVFTLSVALASSAGYGQSLAELAKKEKERREQLGQKGKSFTDRDLRGALPPPLMESSETPPAEGGSAAGSAPSEAAGDATPQEDPSKTPSYWRDRIGKLQRRIAELEGQLTRPGFDQDPTNLARRQRMQRDLEKARADLEAVIDEGRRKGVPPGWLR